MKSFSELGSFLEGLKRSSELSALFGRELGDGFSVLFLSNPCVVEVLQTVFVDLDYTFEAVAIKQSAFINFFMRIVSVRLVHWDPLVSGSVPLPISNIALLTLNRSVHACHNALTIAVQGGESSI